ncbi:hypothetical protein ACFWP3_21005 [Streptomyces sp. NPDC058525]|uniref:hypothetical protein n=1 Tax=Streptomyces sp. NPDC058525 TaxID=3346538 RepID=UPI00366595C8
MVGKIPTDAEMHVAASGDSDSGAYFSFGGNGRANPPIDFSGPYGEITRYERLTAVADDTRHPQYVVDGHVGHRAGQPVVLASNSHARPLAFHVTAGQAGDAPASRP